MSILDAQKRICSDLWLDQEDADQQVEARLQQGILNPEQAEKLHHFVRQGYLIFHLDEDSLFDELDQEVDRIWKKRPADLAFAYNGPLTSMADSIESRDRKPRHRIADIHSHSQAALSLYLHPEIHRWVNLVFGQSPVAFQSLYFQFGSEQSLHRDPVYVVTQPPGHLLAVWIALEDIGPDCGPLAYVPGSHRIPYYEFESDRIAIAGGEDYEHAYAFTMEAFRQQGLEETKLCCKKGDVFLWHGSLVHGGSVVNDPSQTRKSLVVHFSTRPHYRVRHSSFVSQTAQGPLETTRKTIRLLEADGCFGFDNPVRGFRPSGSRARLLVWAKSRLKRLLGR